MGVSQLSDNVVLLDRGGKAQVHTEHFGDSWVKFRKFKTIHDTSVIQQSTVTGKIVASNTKDGQVEMGELALGAAPLQTLIQMIIAWGGPAFCQEDHSDDEGNLVVPLGHECVPLPLEPVYLNAMLNGPGQVILNKIEQFNPTGNPKGNPTNGSGRTS